jgi:hypothetical protein
VLLTFPAQPVTTLALGDADMNHRQPSGGTYRFAKSGALAVDHEFTMGVPLFGQFQDADQAGDDAAYLPYVPTIDTVAALEYFVPAGVEYDPCMIRGDCPDPILSRIAQATMQMTLHYYRVTRTAGGLVRMPLRQVGMGWSVSDAARAATPALEPASTPAPSAAEPAASAAVSPRAYVPIVSGSPDDMTGCPCGWFTPDGRMVDLVPGR